jgi:NO-binding membrane sensor protein with MHYT domain
MSRRAEEVWKIVATVAMGFAIWTAIAVMIFT